MIMEYLGLDICNGSHGSPRDISCNDNKIENPRQQEVNFIKEEVQSCFTAEGIVSTENQSKGISDDRSPATLRALRWNRKRMQLPYRSIP